MLTVQVSRTTSTSRPTRDATPRDASRTRSRTVTPRTSNGTYSRGASVLHTAPAAAQNPRLMTPGADRALQTLPNMDSAHAADSGPVSGADTGEMSRLMNSIASEPGTAAQSVQKEISLMHSTMPANLTSEAVPTSWGGSPPAGVPDLAGANPAAPGLNDTNAAMDYAGFDGGNSLYTIADASGLVTPPSGMTTPQGGFTPQRSKAHARNLSTAPSSEESWVEMNPAGSINSRQNSGWQLQGQPWASHPGSRNGSIDDTPIMPTEPAAGEGTLSPLGPNGMLPSGMHQKDAAVFHPSPGSKAQAARGPLDSDEHLRMHDENRKQTGAVAGGKDVLGDGRTTSADSGAISSPSTKSKGAASSLEDTLGAAVEEAYKLLQERKYSQAEAVLDGARTRYQRKKSMLERFDNSSKTRVSGSGSGTGSSTRGGVAAAATVATGTRRTPVKRSGSVGPSAMQSRIDARSKRGNSSARGVSSTREKGLKSPATTTASKPSPGRKSASGTLARAQPKQAAGNKGPVTTLHKDQHAKASSSGELQSHPVGPYPNVTPSSAPVAAQPVAVQQPLNSATLNSATSLTAQSLVGPLSTGGSSFAGGDIELDLASGSVGPGQVVSMAKAGRNGPTSLPDAVMSMSDTLAGAAPERGPVSAADESAARVGDVVRVGKVRAVVRYVGPVKGLSRGPWVGLELSHPCGTGTGTINGIEYFSCAAQCGAFVALDKLMPDNDAYSTDL